MRISRDLMASDWNAYIDTVAFYLVGWGDPLVGELLRTYLQENFDQDSVIRLVDAYADFDSSPSFSEVKAPTLVMHRGGFPATDVGVSRDLVASIPGARLMIIEGQGAMPWLGESEAATKVIEDFLGVVHSGSTPELEPAAEANSTQLSEGLTRRETEILRLLATGQSNKEMAADLQISVHTVERHIANLYTKLNARGRADAIAYALRHGFGEPS